MKISANLKYTYFCYSGTPIDAKEQYGIYAIDKAKKKTFDILDQCAWI